jgi:hypothetical protein
MEGVASMTQKKGKDRRKFIAAIGGLTGLAGIAGIAALGWATSSQSASDLANSKSQLLAQLQQNQQDIAQMKSTLLSTQQTLGNSQNLLARLSSKWVLFGGGSNLKYMPDSAGNPTVPLEELFYFDSNNAICRVENNPQAFVMPTYSLGNVKIDANSFYMAMISTQVQIDSISPTQTGAKAVLKGTLTCATQAGSAGVTIGSRTASEAASFNVAAVADPQSPSFAYTALFDAPQAPINRSIFGPSATFTGKITSGTVFIKQVKDL